MVEKKQYDVVEHLGCRGDSRVIRAVLDAKFEGDAVELWNAGFVSPEDVTSYWCGNKCHKHYRESPKVIVNIDYMAGERLSVGVAYLCNHCDDVVLLSYLSSAEEIPEKFIESDKTGKYKKPTPESIEALLSETEKQAAESIGGKLNSPNYDTSVLERWAKVIDYKLDPARMEQLPKKWRAAYLKRVEQSLPIIIKEIKSRASGFSITEYDGVTAFESTGLSEPFDELYDALPYISLPEDPAVLQDIAAILFEYNRVFVDEKRSLDEKKVEIEKQIQGMQQAVNEATNSLLSFLGRAHLTREQIEAASKTSLRDAALNGDFDSNRDD